MIFYFPKKKLKKVYYILFLKKIINNFYGGSRHLPHKKTSSEGDCAEDSLFSCSPFFLSLSVYLSLHSVSFSFSHVFTVLKPFWIFMPSIFFFWVIWKFSRGVDTVPVRVLTFYGFWLRLLLFFLLWSWLMISSFFLELEEEVSESFGIREEDYQLQFIMALIWWWWRVV